MKSWSSIAIIVLVALFLTGAAKPTDDKPLLIVVTKANTGQFWQSIRAGASDAARDHAYLEWPSVFRQNEVGGQANVVKQAAAFARRQERPFALILDPLYGAMFADLYHNWQVDYGLPVVTFDEDVVSDDDQCTTNGRSVSFVGTDNREAGRRAGEYMAERLKGKGNVAMLRNNPGVGTTTLREEGFLEVIAEHPDMCAIDANYYWAMNQDIDSAYRTGLTLLRELARETSNCTNNGSAEESGSGTAPNTAAEAVGANRGIELVSQHTRHLLDGVFSSNETTTVGMLRAMESENLSGELTFVGFDHNPLLENALLLGKIEGLIVQDPYTMGKKSVERALELLKKTPDQIKEEALHGQGIAPQHTRFALASKEKLEICRAQVQRGDGSPEFKAKITTFKARSSIFENFLKQQSTGQSRAQEDCDTEVLELLFPDPVTWHLQSPGAES